MDSQSASVLSAANPDVPKGSQCAGSSGPATDVCLDPVEESSRRAVPGNPGPCPVKEAVTTRHDAQPINGNKPEVGGTSVPASQETRGIGEFRLPLTVRSEVPELHSRPIRLKIVVPRRSKTPITDSAVCVTKDFARSTCTGLVLVSSGAEIAEINGGQMQMSAVENEEEEQVEEVTHKNPEDAESESFLDTERRDKLWTETDMLGSTVHTDGSDAPLTSSTHTSEVLSKIDIKEETTERELEENAPLVLREMEVKSRKRFDEMRTEEQTEPLDLSLPKKRETHERRGGRFLEDSGYGSSLIMEVDEFEGEGDRDIVEEDDEGDEEDSVPCGNGAALLSPSFYSTSVFTPPPSTDGDAGSVLLIDDQGIPYTLSPDGVKVPQVDAVTPEEGPQSSNQETSAEVEGSGSPQLPSAADSSLSQSLDESLNAPSDHPRPSPAPVTDSPSLVGDQTETPEVLANSDPSKTAEPSVPSVHADAVLSPPSGRSLPSQPVPVLTNPSTNPPILLLPSSSSSPPMGLTLPLSVHQTAPGTSAPVFLLLSSVPSSSGAAAPTPTPVAVFDPSTGQLSQITAASSPVCLPLPSGQASALGSPLPTPSHPVIRPSPSNAPVVLSGVNTVTSSSALAPPASQNDRNSVPTAPRRSQISSSNSNSGSEAISAEEVLNENNKPSIPAASSPHRQSASLIFDPVAQPSSEAQSPAPEAQCDPPDLHSQHLPLDDHLYFSNPAAPPTEPVLSCGELNPLDPLDTLSSVTSPNAMNPRRVLYCQLCPRVFFYLSDLERHAITHSQKKPHVCHQCGKAFKRSSHLQRHKHIHTGQRNFVCPICTKRFREAGELQRHQRVHTGEKPYQCQLCHTRFAERNTLRRHTKRKHPYHQVAIEMLSERRGGGRIDEGGGGGGGGGSRVQEEEESAEWYSSTVSNLDNSESEVET